ncbi:MAG TPA: hypothetical protein VG387_04935 [Rhizomicrobium sp.]|jgi:hypothetical protein|nr:hypothetical protein [Rhizomicrobium sp.]
MSEEPRGLSARPSLWALLFWIVFALLLVVAFNIWPSLAVSPWHYPWAVAAFFVVMILTGEIWRRLRKR